MPGAVCMGRKFDISLLPPAPDITIEQTYWVKKITRIGGIDEAGRGAWAGPVAAAVVVLPPDPAIALTLSGVRDSKQMSPDARSFWAERIQRYALSWAVGLSSCEEIDQLGILPATQLAACRAIEKLTIDLQQLLLDYLCLPNSTLPQLSIIKGDRRSLSIAAASIIAKTTRDAFLCELDSQYPGYGFARHKGYGTELHRNALRQLGPCPVHRLSFSPVRQS
jgi:ribonuclease HII